MGAIESRGGSQFKLKVTARLSRRSVVQALPNPVVVAISEVDESGPQFLEISKTADPQKLFFEGAQESLIKTLLDRALREDRPKRTASKRKAG